MIFGLDHSGSQPFNCNVMYYTHLWLVYGLPYTSESGCKGRFLLLVSGHMNHTPVDKLQQWVLSDCRDRGRGDSGHESSEGG